MIKEVVFNDIGCADAFNVTFDYLAIVEKIETWNVSNRLNEIDRIERSGTVTQKEISNFRADVKPDQQVLRNEGEISLGKNRRVLVASTRYERPGLLYERLRGWRVQAKNKSGEWYTSDVIIIKSYMMENEESLYVLSIKSNSRNLADQMSKEKFPQKFGKPVLFKYSKGKSEKIEVDVVAIDRHRWQLQDDLFSFGATLEGSGKIEISIPKGEHDDMVIKTLTTLGKIYGFSPTISETESHYFIDSSEYIFKKLGLTRFSDETRKN